MWATSPPEDEVAQGLVETCDDSSDEVSYSPYLKDL